MKNYPDIYYLPEWRLLNETLDGGKSGEFYYQSDLGEVLYPFVKRSVINPLDGVEYYDLITPYGFSGPCILRHGEDKLALLQDYFAKFNAFCKENKIIAEYVRFSPWLNGADDFADHYQMVDNNVTLMINLSDGCFFNTEFSSKCRNIVRKAMKSGIEIKFDFEGSELENFNQMYECMVDKNNVNEYYVFQKDFFYKTFDSLRGHIFIATAYLNQVPISSAMFLYYGNRIHYHLSGNNPEYSSCGANNLLLYEVSCWANQHAITEFHLGGSSKGKIGLFHFKKEFTKSGILNFYVGKRIVNPEIYNELVAQWNKQDNTFFPAYRG